MMMMQAASGGGTNMNEMMPFLMFGGLGGESTTGGSSSTPMGSMGASPAMGGPMGNLGSMFGYSGGSTNAITPAQRDKITQAIIMSGKASSLSRVVNPDMTERMSLEREGLGINPMMQMMVCPRTRCATPMGCESIETPFSPESNYACRACPRCRFDNTGGNMMRMMSMMRPSGGGMMGMNPLFAMMAGGQDPSAAPALGMPASQTGPQMPQSGPSPPPATRPAAPVGTPARPSTMPRGQPPAALMNAMAAMAQARAAAGAPPPGASQPTAQQLMQKMMQQKQATAGSRGPPSSAATQNPGPAPPGQKKYPSGAPPQTQP